MEVLISTEDAQCWLGNGHSQTQVGTQNETGLLESKLAVTISVSKIQSGAEIMTFHSTMHLIYDGSKPYNVGMQQASPICKTALYVCIMMVAPKNAFLRMHHHF